MFDEFDEILDRSRDQADKNGTVRRGAGIRNSASRLVMRLYVAADVPLRARLLASLMRPMGLLGIAGIAAGAFARTLWRRGAADTGIDMAGASRISGKQVRKLASFVEQVDPQALHDFATLIAGSPVALATFSASALMLLYRALPPPAHPAMRTTKRKGQHRRVRTSYASDTA